MTAHQHRSTASRISRALLGIVHGIDAPLALGREHPAPRRRLDHEEVERRLAELYPRN